MRKECWNIEDYRWFMCSLGYSRSIVLTPNRRSKTFSQRATYRWISWTHRFVHLHANVNVWNCENSLVRTYIRRYVPGFRYVNVTFFVPRCNLCNGRAVDGPGVPGRAQACVSQSYLSIIRNVRFRCLIIVINERPERDRVRQREVIKSVNENERQRDRE